MFSWARQLVREGIYSAADWVAGGGDGRRAHMPELSDQQRDAYVHADTAASMVYTYGSARMTRALGQAKEALGGWGNVNTSSLDNAKDLYNNEIGMEIGLYCREHGLSEEQMHQLVREAYDSGILIRDPNQAQNQVTLAAFQSGQSHPDWTPPAERQQAARAMA
jgi:hypothetical protein